MMTIPFSETDSADLRVDAVYRGGRAGNAGDDPLPRLLKVSNAGGFRYRGQIDALEMVVLTSSGSEPDWPDMLDKETGVYTYFGDNRSPGRGLHETPRKGNELLERVFGLASFGLEERRSVPPVFLFANTGEWRDVVFLGLAVPGTVDVRASEDLVAIWRASKGSRFQNYRARFSVLDAPVVPRAWIEDVVAGNPHTSNAPEAWSNWIRTGRRRVLTAARSLEFRTKAEQVPANAGDHAILRSVQAYFRDDPYGFERCAAELARLLLPGIAELDMTRPSRDGGRDAIGKLRIGTGASSIVVEFALEAKRYATATPVSVRDVSRLISRLRHRQFGILVTTSYVSLQAYQEIKEDQHPIIIVAGADVVELLRANGYARVESVEAWLEQNFVVAGKRQ